LRPILAIGRARVKPVDAGPMQDPRFMDSWCVMNRPLYLHPKSCIVLILHPGIRHPVSNIKAA
jgi:hypothetical protein